MMMVSTLSQAAAMMHGDAARRRQAFCRREHRYADAQDRRAVCCTGRAEFSTGWIFCRSAEEKRAAAAVIAGSADSTLAEYLGG